MTQAMKEARQANKEAAKRYVENLTGSADTPVRFRAIWPDPNANINARNKHGTIEQWFDELADLNRQGFGIFMTVNDGGTKTEQITGIRAIFADFDDPKAKRQEAIAALKPHMVVQSSVDYKCHVYWLVSDCPIESAKPAQEALVRQYGSDKDAKDIARVLRLPGFYNTKPKLSEPVMVQILETSEAKPYTFNEIVNGLALDLTTQAKPKSKKAKADYSAFNGASNTSDVDVDQLRAALSFLSPDEYGDWTRYGLAIKATMGDAGYAVWRDWSKKSTSKFKEEVAQAKWDDLTPTGEIGIGSIIHDAKQVGYRRTTTNITHTMETIQIPDFIQELFKGKSNLFELLEYDVDDDGNEYGHGRLVRVQDAFVTDDNDVVVVTENNTLVIFREAGNKHEALKHCEKALQGKVFNYAGGLCVLANASKAQGRILKRVKPSEIQTILSSLATFKKWVVTSRETKDVTIDPPNDWCLSLVEQSDWLHGIDRVLTLSTVPTLRPDGSVVTKSGYDEQTSILFDFAPGDFPPIPENPTKADALAALERVKSYIEEFPFKDEADRAAALGMMLTAIVRPMLSTAPGFLTAAHTPGTGKTLLGRIAVILITGTGSTERPLPNDPEEQRKNVFANLLSARPYIFYDNISGDFSSAALDIMFTSDTFNDRILSQSETKDVSTRVLVLFTGNNVSPIGDTRRRINEIALDAGIENPTERTFKRPNLERDVIQNRGQIVADLLTIARAHVVAGSPTPDEKLTPCGFDEWTKAVREPLAWLGVTDPGAKLIAAIKSDPVKNTLGQVLTSIKALLGNCDEFHVADILTKIGTGVDLQTDPHAEIRELLSDVASGGVVNGIQQVSPKRLAGYFKRNIGRPASGLVIRKVEGEKTRLGVSWTIKPMQQEVNL